MEQIKKIIDFLGNLYPHFSDVERHSFHKSNYTIPKEVTRWWEMGLHDFVTYIHKASGGEGMFAYVKSCQYTDFAIEEFKHYNEELRSLNNSKTVQELNNSYQELKLSISSLVQESFLKSENKILENQELKSLIYGMLEEISELKDHNRSLSERIELLENKPPIILI